MIFVKEKILVSDIKASNEKHDNCVNLTIKNL